MINVVLKMTKDHCEDQLAVHKGVSKRIALAWFPCMGLRVLLIVMKLSAAPRLS
jgi:hypothetical protein